MIEDLSPPVMKGDRRALREGVRSHALSNGRKGSPDSYPLPYPFPDGAVWVAMRDGVVMNMEYMKLPDDFGGSFDAFRQVTRARLSREGAVWSGRVCGGRFWPRFESSDYRNEGAK